MVSLLEGGEVGDLPKLFELKSKDLLQDECLSALGKMRTIHEEKPAVEHLQITSLKSNSWKV